MKKFLVIIDMVNGFVKEGNLADKQINNITPNIIKLINSNNYDAIISFRDCHLENDIEFNEFPIHCIKDTVESEIIDELKPYEKNFIDIPKQTTNGFITPKFTMLWNKIKNAENEFTIVGCCTDICVKNFANSLLKSIKVHNLNTNVIILKNCVATFNSKDHKAVLHTYLSLKELKDNGAIIYNNIEEMLLNHNIKKNYELEREN